jgi:hypothetical protein
LSAIFGNELIVVLGQTDFVHLSGFSKSLKFDLVTNVHFALCLLKEFIKFTRIDRPSVRPAYQQPVILILAAKEFFLAIDLLKPLVDLLSNGDVKYCFRLLPSVLEA